MTMTTRVRSVSIPVADQDRALEFYTTVLGCELRTDIEVWPGARLVEVVPPGSSVGLVLLPPDSEIPMAVRLGTTSAETAYARLRQAGREASQRRDRAPRRLSAHVLFRRPGRQRARIPGGRRRRAGRRLTPGVLSWAVDSAARRAG